MAIPAYPDGLPCPLREAYKRTPVNTIRRTPMDSGRARQRVEFPNAPDLIQLTWLMNPGQAMVFDSWVVRVVGSGWFNMELLSPLGFTTEEVRFTSTPEGGELTGKFLWRYKVVCESRKRPLVPPEWIDILPDYILYPDIFDKAINWIKP